MGFTKERYFEAFERGWSSLGDKYVCDRCFNDDALARFVREFAVSRHCDYCGRKSKGRPIAAAIDQVVEYIDAGVRSEWGDPNNELPYDSREGGYQGTVYDASEVLQGEYGDCFANDHLLEDITEAYDAQGTQFCERDYFGLAPCEALRYGWQEFCRVVKHKTRFLFLAERDEHYRSSDEITPATFLSHLGKVIDEVGLVKVLPAGTRFYRVRVHMPGVTVQTAKDLGTPPVRHSRFSNRMSPAGIPLFYGAFDRKTAVKETYDPQMGSEVRITGGEFVAARPLVICDFTNLPRIPSLFETEMRQTRHDLIFLRDFVADLSRPIERDGREHIEYVPTQVVTEFLRRVYLHPELGAVHGIMYRSAQHSGGKCCALFFEAEDCTDVTIGWADEVDGGDYKWWLGLHSGSLVTRKPPRVRGQA